MNATLKEGTLRERLQSGRFGYGIELVTTRGFVTPEKPNAVVELGRRLAAEPRVDWLSITDNPGGHMMLPPDWLGRILSAHQKPIVLHLTCKDLNRNGLESTAWKYASEGFENILAMTGDYPRNGFGGVAAPVFDLDSVSLIQMLNAMNQGFPVPEKKGEGIVLPRTNFYIGCAVSPFKRHERELMPQYFKFLRKISAGAQIAYTQLGYDMRKFHEVLLFLENQGITMPVIGNVYLLNRTVAGLFHRRQVPGCVVSDRLMELCERYAKGPDKGRAFFLDFAAKQLAAFRALGFAAGYLGGTTKAETFLALIERAERYSAADGKQFAKEIQFAQPDEFYLFEQDPATGLGVSGRINRAYLASLRESPTTKENGLGYRMSRFVHDKVFTPGTSGFRLMQRLYGWLEHHPTLARGLHRVEYAGKALWYGCRDCGDCSLPDCSYLCPLESCSKNARNGPCGGSQDGRCEVDDKECMWARAYERLKAHGETEPMLEGKTVYTNATLRGTSAWANTFLGRDHHAETPPPSPPPDAKG
ncbi:MAG: methylenetetrahydrofolate reductase C-terminal domain-containing protein [Verrucomicrobiae bacterium]|nr:methylenetetrahydrofolate reductase C-terminal domain-containing protein [Verrucomicrobiae bacterium]